MLSKSHRLNLKKSFTFVTAGKKRELENVKIFYRLGENEQPLVGIALTKKNFHKAHDRNRAKRLVSSAIEKVYPHLIHNLNLVIMPKVTVLQKASDELIKEFEDVYDLYSSD